MNKTNDSFYSDDVNNFQWKITCSYFNWMLRFNRNISILHETVFLLFSWKYMANIDSQILYLNLNVSRPKITAEFYYKRNILFTSLEIAL